MKDKKALEHEVSSSILAITGRKIEDVNCDLFGKPYYLKPRDMVYLFIEIQKNYNIKIPEEIIISKKFSTVDEISKIIINNVKNKTEGIGI